MWGLAAFRHDPINCQCCFRVHGYDPISIVTYGLVVGMLKSAHSFGAMLGPTVSGMLTQEMGFEWTSTIIAATHLVLVS